MSDETIATIGYRLDKFPTLNTRIIGKRSKVFDVAVRTKRLDEIVRRFVTAEPDAVVLDLGAGLDGRMFRVKPPPTVTWYDIDFPEVIAIRRQVLPQPANAHTIGADLTDPRWLQDLPANRPAIMVADGVMPFLTHDNFVSLVYRLGSHFPGGQLALNAYTTYGIWVLRHARAMRPIAGDVVNRGINDPREPEDWINGLTLLDEVLSTRAPEVADMPLIGRLASRLAARSSTVSRRMATAVLHYRFPFSSHTPR